MVVLVENKLWEPIEPGTVTENNQMAVDGEDFGKVSNADKTYNSVLSKKMSGKPRYRFRALAQGRAAN